MLLGPYADRETMATMNSPTDRTMREELLHAAVGLLDDHGPDALQSRKVSSAAATSTMAVYTHFGGMRGLIAAVAEEGRRQFDIAVAVPDTDDPVADMFFCGIAYRTFAIERPHLYRLMFGSTSSHGIDAPGRNLLTMTIAEIRVEYAAFGRLVHIVQRCMQAGRISVGSADDETVVITTSSQLWAPIHGFVMLELAGYYGDGVAALPVLGAIIGNLLVALGDSPELLMESLAAAGVL
jgi:AcrR family transcriptional regulator